MKGHEVVVTVKDLREELGDTNWKASLMMLPKKKLQVTWLVGCEVSCDWQCQPLPIPCYDRDFSQQKLAVMNCQTHQGLKNLNRADPKFKGNSKWFELNQHAACHFKRNCLQFQAQRDRWPAEQRE